VTNLRVQSGLGALLTEFEVEFVAGRANIKHGAEDVDDDLPVVGGVLAEPLQGVQAAEADQGRVWPSCSTALV
jgi:hypothetical protein